MADINVERKGPSIWPWIIGLIVLALLIWILVEMFDSDEPDVEVDEPVPSAVVTPDVEAPVDAAMPAAVTTYLTQCAGAQGAAEGDDMGRQHEYTVNCLQQLREGISAVIAEEQLADTDVSARLDEFTNSVEQLQDSDPADVTHSNLTRDAARTAVTVMQAMQNTWFATEEPIQSAVGEVQQAAEGIQGDAPMLEQREAVHTLFREAGDALRMMAERRSMAGAA